MSDKDAKPALSSEAQAQLSELALALAHNPKTRKKFVGLVKEIDPSRRFPDVETDQIREDMEKEFEKRDQAREAARVKERMESQRESLKSRYEDKDIEEIEKLMEKKGISDYEDGATLYSAVNKPAKPTHDIKSHAWEMPTVDRKDFNNLTQISRKKAYEAIDDLQTKRKHA